MTVVSGTLTLLQGVAHGAVGRTTAAPIILHGTACRSNIQANIAELSIWPH